MIQQLHNLSRIINDTDDFSINTVISLCKLYMNVENSPMVGVYIKKKGGLCTLNVIQLHPTQDTLISVHYDDEGCLHPIMLEIEKEDFQFIFEKIEKLIIEA